MNHYPHIKLRDCPFCGAPANLHKTLLGDFYAVDCSGIVGRRCGVEPSTNPAQTPEAAAAVWNGKQEDARADVLARDGIAKAEGDR